MAKYIINYWECYSGTYCVEAENFKEAQEKLREAIQNDRVDGPVECYDSGYSNDTSEYTVEELDMCKVDVK